MLYNKIYPLYNVYIVKQMPLIYYYNHIQEGISLYHISEYINDS